MSSACVSGETYFHYTSKASGDAIRKSGYIQSSSGGAAGEGVYLTKMSPFYNDASTISLNNWQIKSLTRTRRVFEIEISSDVKNANLYQRDVYIYTNGDLELEDRIWVYYDWSSGVKGKLTVITSGTQFLQFNSSFMMICVVVSFNFFT